MSRRGKGNIGPMTKPAGEFAPWMGVFETLRVVDGVPLFVAEHRMELGRAMEALGLETDFDFEQARAALPPLSGRWRWIVTEGETRTLFSEEETVVPDPVALSVSIVRVGSCNWDARYKTLSYLSHIQARKAGGTSEVILLNEHGHIRERGAGEYFLAEGQPPLYAVAGGRLPARRGARVGVEAPEREDRSLSLERPARRG